MCKHGEMFHADKGYILAINVLEIYGNKKYKFVVQFSNVICTKTKPCTPTSYMKMNHFNIVFHMT